MAVFKTLTFDNENSLDYGVYITGEAVYNAPERAMEMVSIPGKNGTIPLDQGRFENISVKYPAGAFGKTQSEFASNIMKFRNVLASRYRYVRLSDDYNTDEFRLGMYRSGLETKPVSMSRAGEFDITFDCKPQRFLVSGETPQTADDWSDVETETGSVVTIEANDTTGIKDLTADIEPIQDLHGYDKPWVGGAGKNKCPNITSQIAGSGITATWQTDGTLKLTGTASGNVFIGIAFSIVAGSYVLSGCPSGGGDSTYQLDIRSSVGSGVLYSRDIGSGLSFSPSADLTAYVNIRIANGYACPSGGLIFKPMIRKSTESADFEPYKNICPISGHTDVVVSRTGKNLCDTSLVYDGYINVSQQKIASNANARTLYLPCKPNTAYTVSKQAGQRFVVAESTELPTNNVLVSGVISDYTASSITITTSATAKYLVAFVYLSTADTGVTADQMLATCQIELGSTATTYEPYQGDTYTTALGTTVYGGTLDVTSGVLTIDKAIAELGSLTWGMSTTLVSGITVFSSSDIADKKLNSAFTSSQYKYLTSRAELANNDGGIAQYNAYGKSVVIRDDRYTDATAFKNALTSESAIICYELATPMTVQLTAQEVSTLLGQNNVWASSGDVTVEFGVPPFTNPTMFPSNPLIKVTGIGTLTVGDTSIVITGTASQVIYIDCESMEIYKINGGVITPAGSLVSFSTPDFPKLMPGINIVTMGTGITDVEMTPRWWRI